MQHPLCITVQLKLGIVLQFFACHWAILHDVHSCSTDADCSLNGECLQLGSYKYFVVGLDFQIKSAMCMLSPNQKCSV